MATNTNPFLEARERALAIARECADDPGIDVLERLHDLAMIVAALCASMDELYFEDK